MRFVVVNPGERSWTRHRYVLWFSNGGVWVSIYLLVWANSLDDALDEAVDYISDHAAGLLDTEYVHSEYELLLSHGLSSEQAWAEATQDMICAGNNGDWISSQCCGVEMEDPTRDVLKKWIAAKDLRPGVQP